MQQIKIKSIKKLDKKNDRYDLTIGTTHNFFANGICIHNTSQRFAYLLEETTYPRYTWGWLKQKLGLEASKEWKHVIGTRNVTLGSLEGNSKVSGNGWYKDETFRTKVVKELQGKLHKGEILFFEVVGWMNNTTSIMPAADTKSVKDKEFQKRYGNKMHYSYGCSEGSCDIFVYRIASVDEDGFCIDLTWDAVKTRCNQLGIKTVVDLVEPFVYDGDEDKLRELVEKLSEGGSIIDQRHIREGVCVRAERYPTPLVAKNKNFIFKVLEGIAKDNSDYVDEEESA